MGPAAGPARAINSSSRSSGLSDKALRSSPLSTTAPTVLVGLTLTSAPWPSTVTFSGSI